MMCKQYIMKWIVCNVILCLLLKDRQRFMDTHYKRLHCETGITAGSSCQFDQKLSLCANLSNFTKMNSWGHPSLKAGSSSECRSFVLIVHYHWHLMLMKCLNLISVWGYVGYGHASELDKDLPEKKSEDPYRIIVSRSHAGTVETVAKSAFGEKTVVIPAGGAGVYCYNLCTW